MTIEKMIQVMVTRHRVNAVTIHAQAPGWRALATEQVDNPAGLVGSTLCVLAIGEAPTIYAAVQDLYGQVLRLGRVGPSGGMDRRGPRGR